MNSSSSSSPSPTLSRPLLHLRSSSSTHLLTTTMTTTETTTMTLVGQQRHWPPPPTVYIVLAVLQAFVSAICFEYFSNCQRLPPNCELCSFQNFERPPYVLFYICRYVQIIINKNKITTQTKCTQDNNEI